MRLNYNKPLNLALEPDHAAHASRIIRCVGTSGCKRTVVEYGLHLPETRHVNGIPELAMEIAIEAGAVVVDGLCNRHGGRPYERHTPVMPPVEVNAV